MPHYVAARAFNLIGAGILKPRILLLGVAYKPGVADVRETPVQQLREYLVANGAEVAWCDPLVNDWGGTNSVSLNWPCDVAILATRQPGLDLVELIARGTPILDCTNSFTNVIGIYPL
jgi:UDP-N-acetyl-D-glucosamine dehydrogenase